MTYFKQQFPTIDASKPYGSYRVSTIDNHERETRRWLQQCMKALSGYPDIDTVGIIGWTDSTRPNKSPNGNYLLGYNVSTQQLEVVGEDGNLANISKAFILQAHPVGTIYETTDYSFNPNVEWGGVWEKWEDGRFLLSSSENHAVGSFGGEEETALLINQMPRHHHRHTHQHSHTRGTMNITGTFNAVWEDNDGAEVTGAFYATEESSMHNEADGYSGSSGRTWNFDASRSWEGHTSYDDTQSSDSYVGEGEAHNNMPPYRVVCRWHRVQ